jgi:hypothetical protein
MSDPVVPFALCIDVEPDDIEIDLAPRPWVGFERLVGRASALRASLGEATARAARFSWFLRMDPQIAESHGSPRWVADRYGDAIAALREQGDVIGLHPHAWRWLPQRRKWIADHGDAAWIDNCLRTSIAAYETAFGERCRFVRWGDRFLSARAIALEAMLGAEFDLTVEPGAPQLRSMHPRAAATGSLISMEYAPREPYRPSRNDPRVAATTPSDDVGLWEVPLTALDPDPVLSPLRWFGRRVRHYGRPLHRPASMVAPMWPAVPFWQGVQDYLTTAPRPHLAFAVRSDVPIRAESIAALDAKFAALQDLPLRRRLAFTTPDHLVAALSGTMGDREHVASSRQVGTAAR